MPRILAFAGSVRAGSWNRKLARAAAELARAHGADVTLAELSDHPMPLYDGDLEAADGLPDAVRRWKDLFGAHDGLLIACPEYNSSITPLLKNAIDWASRPAPGAGPLAAFRGKTAALVATSPGALGGLRGLVTVRSILGNVGVHVVPNQLAVPKAPEMFDADGNLTDDGVRGRLDGVVAQLVETTARLAEPR
jgi:NAD(P)H-dependent FMN reductase